MAKRQQGRIERGRTDLGVLGVPQTEQVARDVAVDTPRRVFEPVYVDCPVCGRGGTTRMATNHCAGCGSWFIVRDGEGDRDE